MNKFEGSYIEWFKSELKGWNPVMWTIWAFGFGFQTSILVTNTITWQAIVTYLATLVGLLCTCSMAEGRPINGLLGLISVVGFVLVNAMAHHWWSVLDQVIFALAIDIPLIKEWRTWGQDFNAKVRKLDGYSWVLTIAAVFIAWLALYKIALRLNDPRPSSDSLVLALGAMASILCLMHVSNTYTLWLAEDAVNIFMWFYALKDGYSPAALPMLVSTIMYTVTAIYGQWFSVWNKAVADNETV
ncbi:MAG TPA: nicotinamide riboside transporter PnuC [Ligilactobacillus acidipiscis]|uniref:Nicotinamide riboside transporter PnuC n=1 Tax=Ligilactobacillus acidipiscis TaxID=89059 RepID=A0A921K0I4_9LACO|nr:nicotinamide riboside transporter PnuC [Ligilactobacillus acidipiscis]